MRSLVLAFLSAPFVLLPLALWANSMADRVCFRGDTGKPMCDVWQTPEGYCQILRKDAGAPPKGWQLVRTASREDVKACSPSPEEQEKNRPQLLDIESCASMPQFFDGAGARVYWIRKGNKYELWDRAGRHPVSGLPLQPMTIEVAEQVCEQLEAESRRRDDLRTAAELESERRELARLELERQEQARQEQARQEQARQEQARQEQARQEQVRQEQARQEQVRLEQARAEPRPQGEALQQPQAVKNELDRYAGIRIR